MKISRKVVALLLALFFVQISSCGGGGTDSTGPMTEMISGVVVQTAAFMEPVGGALVSTAGAETTTDADGFYSLRNLSSGPITIETQEGSVSVFDLSVASAVQSATVNFFLNPPSAESSEPAVSVSPASSAGGPGNFINSASEPLVLFCVDAGGSYCEVSLSGRTTRDSTLNYYIVSRKSGQEAEPFFVHYPRIRALGDSWRYVTQLPMDEMDPAAGDVHNVYLVATVDTLNFLQDIQYDSLAEIPTVTYVTPPREVVLNTVIIIE